MAEVYAAARDVYWSLDWSADFYVALVKAGFISTACEVGEGIRVLIPEIQKAYAVLDWENLHTSRSLRRWLRSEDCVTQAFELSVGHDLPAVIAEIRRCHGSDNWLIAPYCQLLKKLMAEARSDFEIIPVGLVNQAGQLVAGEIGYRFGDSYTSLTGFADRSHKNAGKLQLRKLAEYLRDAGFAFWNLGHPHMQYKLDLGAKITERKEFLQRWLAVGENRPGMGKWSIAGSNC